MNKALRPWLDVLIIGTHHHGSAGVNSLYAHLGAFPTVKTLNSTHKIDVARQYIHGGKVNTIFLDPSPFEYTQSGFEQIRQFIEGTRQSHPQIVFVIYTNYWDHFLKGVGGRFSHYFHLNKDKVNYEAGPELKAVLLRCEDWHRNLFEYDVALSFAGEQRNTAERLAQLVSDSGGRAFYDQYEQADLWGKNLYTHLHEIYNKTARYCIMLISQDYARKVWTSHEREAAQERALHEKGTE